MSSTVQNALSVGQQDDLFQVNATELVIIHRSLILYCTIPADKVQQASRAAAWWDWYFYVL